MSARFDWRLRHDARDPAGRHGLEAILLSRGPRIDWKLIRAKPARTSS
jgi:hypothetical protein